MVLGGKLTQTVDNYAVNVQVRKQKTIRIFVSIENAQVSVMILLRTSKHFLTSKQMKFSSMLKHSGKTTQRSKIVKSTLSELKKVSWKLKEEDLLIYQLNSSLMLSLYLSKKSNYNWEINHLISLQLKIQNQKTKQKKLKRRSKICQFSVKSKTKFVLWACSNMVMDIGISFEMTSETASNFLLIGFRNQELFSKFRRDAIN